MYIGRNLTQISEIKKILRGSGKTGLNSWKELNYYRKKEGGVERKECLRENEQENAREGMVGESSMWAMVGPDIKEFVSHVRVQLYLGVVQSCQTIVSRGMIKDLRFRKLVLHNVENGLKSDKTEGKQFMRERWVWFNLNQWQGYREKQPYLAAV